MSSKLPGLPDSITDPAVKSFLSKFYDVSNEAELHDDCADLFTADGEYHMNSKKAKGRKEILALRKAMWAHVPDRDHKPIQIYTHGSDQMDLMIHGDVSYNHHYGHQTGADWAAKVKLAMEGGEIKMAYYQIIVDSAAHV